MGCTAWASVAFQGGGGRFIAQDPRGYMWGRVLRACLATVRPDWCRLVLACVYHRGILRYILQTLVHMLSVNDCFILSSKWPI